MNLSREEPRDIRFKEPTFIDPLTGLFNQYYLYQFLPEEIEKARLSNYPLTVFMIDLDGFKNINDTYGHLCGDEILRQLVVIFKKSTRRTDMVIRYAGDEFTFLLPTLELKRAQTLANQLIENVNKNVFKGREGQDLHLTISIGIAMYPYDTDEMDKLIDLADKALYLSKHRGKNRFSQAKEVTLEAVSSLIAMDSFPCPRFIDREKEIDVLKQTFDTMVLQSNLSQFIFISGEEGVGKTRLLDEVNKYVGDRAAIISYHGSPMHTQDPYYLFAESISMYIEKVGIDSPGIYSLISQIPPLELLALSRVIPLIANFIRRPVDSEADDKKTRFLLFKGFLDFLIELNKISAVVLSFDDIHWIDKASLELLRYLNKQEKNKRIFVLCTFIDDKSRQIVGYTNLEGLLEDIRLNDNFAQIELANFSLDDTSKMVDVIFPGIGAAREFCELIYNITKGNPTFIEELLRSFIEDAIIFYEDKRWRIKEGILSQDISSSAEELIKKKLRNLDEETKEMIAQAAVIGTDFSADLLRKIDNKDEGFMLELLNRAKKMRLIDELETRGQFAFLNKNLQSKLYSEINNEQRKQLHYKIGQVITEEHKDNLYNVASELAFHFTNSFQQEMASEYSQIFLQKVNQIFSPYEILEYLDKLSEKIVEEEAVLPLTDEILKETMGFIRSLQGAVKNFQLYPPGAMRASSIKEAHSILNTIFKETNLLNLGEVEKDLVINGKRISSKERQQFNVEYFLTLMLEHNLKTISFIKGIHQDQLDEFIQYFSKPPEYIKNEGGWTEIINKAGIKGIKIDEVRFVQVGGATRVFEGKEKLEEVMLMEFLLGKIDYSNIDRKAFIHNMGREPQKFAQTLMEAAKEIVEQGKANNEEDAVVRNIEKINSQILSQESDVSDSTKNLAKVVMELKPIVRNKVIRSQFLERGVAQKEATDNIIKSIPDEVLVDIIIEDFKEKQENLIVVKDFIEKILTDDYRKKEIISKVEKELLKLNVAKDKVDYITGKIEWEDLPLDKRINDLTRLPNEYYNLELEKIKALLEELYSKQMRKELDDFLYHLIQKTAQLQLQASKELKAILTDFVKASFDTARLDAFQIESRLDGLLKKLDVEPDPKVYRNLLALFKDVIKEFTLKFQPSINIISELEKPVGKKYCMFIYQLLNLLSKRLKLGREHNPQIYELSVDFIREISYGQFLEALVYSIINNPSKEELPLREILPLIENNLVDTLIKLETQRDYEFGDSFREYIMRKGVAELLEELGEPILNILRQKLSQMQEQIPAPLIELVGYLKKEDWTDLLLSWIHHKDPLIRRTVLMALADIGTEKAQEIMSKVVQEEKDKKIRLLAKEQLRKLKKRE